MSQPPIISLWLRGLADSVEWQCQFQKEQISLPQLSCSFFSARSAFESGAFEQCTELLAADKSDHSKFLCFYARYLHLERKHSSYDAIHLFHEGAPSLPSYPFEQLLLQCNSESDAFFLFLRALIRKRLGDRSEALRLASDSVALFPDNWQCWELILALVSDATAAEEIASKAQGLCSMFFKCLSLIRIGAVDHPMLGTALRALQEQFPQLAQVQLIQAELFYAKRDFAKAQLVLEALVEKTCGQNFFTAAELLANVYYVKEERDKLSGLAQRCYECNPLRPETNSVLGNFFSLRNDHERAIRCFKRSLRLNAEQSGAWTLMGHEYLEVRNTDAAIESYNEALSRKPTDYRAWYGLGQAYELLRMNSFASFYYERATSARPQDSRMWSALGAIQEAVGREDQAIASFAKAVSLNQSDAQTAQQCIRLLRRANRAPEATALAQTLIEESEFWDQSDKSEITKVLWFLAHQLYLRQPTENAEKVCDLCNRILLLDGMESESAKELLRSIGWNKR